MSRKKKSGDGIPKDAVKQNNNHLAEGEVTGHYHAATAKDSALYRSGETLFLSAPSGTSITHQEHREFSVPPGDYRVDIVKEYDHLKEEARAVMD